MRAHQLPPPFSCGRGVLCPGRVAEPWLSTGALKITTRRAQARAAGDRRADHPDPDQDKRGGTCGARPEAGLDVAGGRR